MKTFGELAYKLRMLDAQRQMVEYHRKSLETALPAYQKQILESFLLAKKRLVELEDEALPFVGVVQS